MVHSLDVEIVYLAFVERNYQCHRCGSLARLHDTGHRLLADVDCNGPVFLHVTVGVYRCRGCGCNFRHPIRFARPGYLYTERVVSKCVDAVVLDGMPFCRVPGRMRRDFFVAPSEKSVRRWVREAARAQGIAFSNHAVVRSFRGKVAMDGVYERNKAAFVLLDAETGETLHLELDVREDAETLKGVFERLKAAGWAPEVVVMDEGPGLARAVGDVFPEAEQVVCWRHVLGRLRKRVRMGIKDYGYRLKPQREKRGRGRPRKSEVGPEDLGRAFRSRKARNLLIWHPGRLTAQRRAERKGLLEAHPEIRQLIWAYLRLWRALSGRGDLAKTVAEVRRKVGNVEGQLKTILDRFTDEFIEKLSAYRKHDGLDGTNNICERWARRFRKRQKAHYRLRSEPMRRAVFGLEEATTNKHHRQRTPSVRGGSDNRDGEHNQRMAA